MNSQQVYTYADFTKKSKSDVEDLFHPELFCKILNSAYGLDETNSLTVAKLSNVTPYTEGQVKQAESVFSLLPNDIRGFDHFTPANWLIKNQEVLEVSSNGIEETLLIAQKIFLKINAL